MASIISAGTSTGTALNLTGDTSGALALASNNGTTALTIDTSQNVGIGTTTPSTKFTVVGNVNTTGNLYTPDYGYIGNSAGTFSGINTGFQTLSGGSGYLLSFTNGSERMRIDASGNVGIGTTSPVAKLQVTSSTNRAYAIVQTTATTSGPEAGIQLSTPNKNFYVFSDYDTSSFNVYDATSAAFRMRITTGGDLQFNSGYGSLKTAYGCRAWVCFNGTGTVAILGSGNISSITDNGVGSYIVNYATSMVDANYAVVAGQQRAGTSDFVNEGFNRGTNSTQIETFANTTQADFPKVQLAFFR